MKQFCLQVNGVQDHKTPLHVAAENGHTNVVEILVDKFKASITARTIDGDTLMHIAAMSGHAQTALAFLKRGVPLHMPNKVLYSCSDLQKQQQVSTTEPEV